MHVIVHYGEIGTKGANRPRFERQLCRNIRRQTGLAAKRGYGYLTIETDESEETVREKLGRIFGIANFAFAVRAELELDDIQKKARDLAVSSPARTFAVRTHRANKSFPLTSLATNKAVGDVIDKQADLSHPELPIHIDILSDRVYVYGNKEQGLGGLPVGSAGKVIALVSGGIDSPVAAWLAMKRGCRVIFVHFHNYTLYAESVRSKMLDLVAMLARYQGPSRLYIMPFRDVQAAIIRGIEPKYRMLVYRRAMLRIAERIREQEHGLAFVTGDTIAQVASQTLSNLHTIYSAASRPVLAPLISFDKNETIRLAERLGTYAISIRPYEDCCQYFIAPNPATKSNVRRIEEKERRLELDAMIDAAAADAECVRVEAAE